MLLSAALLLAATSQDAPIATRPKFTFLRQDEDWSTFLGATVSDRPLDAIKHVTLDAEGDVWASFGGRIEARLENWRHFGFGGAGGATSFDDTFVLSRAFLHADVHVGDALRVFTEGKTAQSTDRDLPGGRRPLDLDTLELQQAFVEVEAGEPGDALRLRVGRQALLLGNQRLVSPLPWGNTLRAWDGATAAWSTGRWTVNGLATAFVPVDKTSPNEVDRDTTLFGLYATRAPADGGRGLDLYWLGNQRDAVAVNGTTGDERRSTFGFRTWGPIGERTDLEVEAAYQTGSVGAGDVDAWFVAAQAGWRAKDWAGAPRFYVGLDAASGDDAPGGDVGTFHQLFPLGHAYLGYADLIGRQNSFDLSAGARWTVAQRTTLAIDLHHFRVMDTADALYNAGGQPIRTGLDARDVANEVDVLVRSKIDRHVDVYGGYSHVFAGDAIESTGSSEDVDFVYVGAAYTF